MISILTHVPHLDSITFGYNGEPTLNENLLDFLEIATEVRDKLDWIKQKPNLTLFTNSSTIPDYIIRNRIKEFEVVLAKLDVATSEDFKRTNRPYEKSPNIGIIVDSLAKLKQLMPKNHTLTIQTLLYNSYKEDFIPNNNRKNIEELAKAIKKIKPDNVQIYSIARIPAEYFVYSVDDIKKQEIAKHIEEVVDDKNVQVDFY